METSKLIISWLVLVSSITYVASWISVPTFHHGQKQHHGFSNSILQASVSEENAVTAVADDTVPIILLSGFLGSGKTTTLKHLLENKEGRKLGVIVNDVAAINIDAKLLSQQQASADGNTGGGDIVADNSGDVSMIELQNGCACCSIADELITSVNQMLEMKQDWDAIVVELSGVADPVATKLNWEDAQAQGLPGTDKANIGNIVTLVDACTFGTDWMSWDSVQERDGWLDAEDDCAGKRKIPELLAEQIESANLIVMNKIDMAESEQVTIASKLARAINKEAQLIEVEFGSVSPNAILKVVEKLEVVEEEVHSAADCDDPDCKDESHDHSHGHSPKAESCREPDCTDDSHSHSHEHADEACNDPACTDESHKHSHDKKSDVACSDPACTDESHSHSHGDTDDAAACDDPGCTDEGHSHSHSHAKKTSTDKLGITNFVYKSARPFNAPRLMALLGEWPVPKKEVLDLGELAEAQNDGYNISGDTIASASPFLGVLRSKGFCWISPSKWKGTGDAWRHDSGMFWSHAGKHFGITISGKWWATISKEKMKEILSDNPKEYERIINDDFASEEFGDRRQEIVFIGAGISEEKITNALNDCLVTEKELSVYRQELKTYKTNIIEQK